MNVLPFCHPRKLTEREIEKHVERIMSALRRIGPPETEK